MIATRPRRIFARFVRRPEADLSKLPLGFDIHALDIIEGFRAALSVAVIVALEEWLHWPSLMTAALAAWLACLCDQGGAIQRRLPAVLGFTLASAVAFSGAGLARNGGVWVAIPFASAGLFGLSMLRIHGQSALVVGNLLSVMLVLGLDRPIDLPTAGSMALACIAGGLWATLLTMVIWRIHPYQPVRQAVAGAYRALGDLVQDVIDLLHGGPISEAEWDAHARAHRRVVRETIETTRGVVMDTARVRGTVSERAAEGLLRLEVADQIFGAVVAASELLEHDESLIDRAAMEGVLRRLRVVLALLARAIQRDDTRSNPQLERFVAATEARVAEMPEDSALRRIADVLAQRLRIALTLSGSVPSPSGVAPHPEPPIPFWKRVLDPLKANLDWSSVSLRHASRVAVSAVPAVAISLIWAGPYQHWLTITWVLTMQPQFALTILRAVERIGGTIVGGLVAAVLVAVCRTPLAMSAALFPLAMIALAVRQVSFGLFITVITPLVVILSELGDVTANGWEIAGMRALFTVIGGLLALGACLLLWPSWEPGRLFQEMRTAIAAHGRYAEAELSALLGEIRQAEVEQARRAAGVAANNMEASLGRSLHEPGHAGRFRLEAVMVIDAALRRMGGRLSAMQLDPGMRAMLPPEAWRAWRDWIGGAMRALASDPPALPLPLRPAIQNPLPTDTLPRLARQIELIAGALRRVGSGP